MEIGEQLIIVRGILETHLTFISIFLGILIVTAFGGILLIIHRIDHVIKRMDKIIKILGKGY